MCKALHICQEKVTLHGFLRLERLKRGNSSFLPCEKLLQRVEIFVVYKLALMECRPSSMSGGEAEEEFEQFV